MDDWTIFQWLETEEREKSKLTEQKHLREKEAAVDRCSSK